MTFFDKYQISATWEAEINDKKLSVELYALTQIGKGEKAEIEPTIKKELNAKGILLVTKPIYVS